MSFRSRLQSTSTRTLAICNPHSFMLPVNRSTSSQENKAVSEQDQRKTKEFQKVPFQHLEAVTRSLELSDAELGLALGYSGSGTISGWRKEGEAPKVAYIAAQELVRRAKPNTPPVVIDKTGGSALIVLQVETPDDRAFLELMLERTKGIKVVFRS